MSFMLRSVIHIQSTKLDHCISVRNAAPEFVESSNDAKVLQKVVFTNTVVVVFKTKLHGGIFLQPNIVASTAS